MPRVPGRRIGAGMIPRFLLDNPEQALAAWARYKRLMRFMMGMTTIAVLFAFAALYRSNGMVSVHLYIATALGIGFAMLLMSALMGLVFLSSASGHDATVNEPLGDDPRDLDSIPQPERRRSDVPE